MMGLIRIRPKLQLLKELYGDYKPMIFILVVLAVISGLLGALGIAILVPLFSFIVGEDSSGKDPISRFVLGAFDFFGIEPELKFLLILISSLFVLKAAVLWIFGLVRTKIISSYSFDLRKKIYRKTVFASWQHLMRHKLGYLENILMVDVRKVKNLLKNLITTVLQIANATMYLIVSFGISVSITSITLGAGAAILMFTKPLISKVKKYSKKRERIYKSIAHQINENIVGLKAIKAARIEKSSIKDAVYLFEILRQLTLKNYFVTSFISQPLEPLMVIFITVVFAISYSLNPDFSIALFLVVVYLIQRIFSFVSDIQRGLSQFNKNAPNAERIIEFTRAVEKNKEKSRGREPFRFSDELTFRGVRFSYSGKENTVLADISLSIKKGEIFGIAGPSGAGKTTVVDLLLRLFDPEAGEILVDGRNVEDISLGEWRGNIGYVPQESFLKNDTIANNIRFFRRDIFQSDIEQAAKQADIYDFVQGLPRGFETIVGERGVFLSGGERQRMMLARALAGRPRILILDEATSALDHASEKQIQQTIDRLRGSLTVIIIAHRASAIRIADRIAIFSSGRIIEIGTSDSLRKNPNSYFNKMLSTI